MSDLTKKKQKELARLLYIHEQLTKKETALRVGVSEKTVGTWSNEENWEDQRASFARTRSFQLQLLNANLNNKLDEIQNREEGHRFPTTADSDILVKLANAISLLEHDTGIAVKIEVGKNFLDFVRLIDLDKSQEFAELWDAYIKSNLK